MVATDSPVERKRPAYELIAATLRNAIEKGMLAPGVVLTESHLSALFGASRSPIKQAFSALEDERLVRRFEGRGVVVGGEAHPPARVPVTAAMLGIADDPAEAVRDDAWDTLYYALERDVILSSIFGRFRVNELGLARHFGVGRTVARNLLLRAELAGLVAKADGSHWFVVEMNETRMRDLYELRIQLEPPLAKSAVSRIPPDVVVGIESRLHAAARHFEELGVAELDALEIDLHRTCLSYGRNVEMIAALKRTQCILLVGKHIQAEIDKNPRIDPFVDEHLVIVEAIKAGRGTVAATALQKHLKDSETKAAARLAAFRDQYDADVLPPYIQRGG